MPWTAVYAPIANERGVADRPDAAPAGEQRHRQDDDAVDGRERRRRRRASAPISAALDQQDDEDAERGVGDAGAAQRAARGA